MNIKVRPRNLTAIATFIIISFESLLSLLLPVWAILDVATPPSWMIFTNDIDTAPPITALIGTKLSMAVSNDKRLNGKILTALLTAPLDLRRVRFIRALFRAKLSPPFVYQGPKGSKFLGAIFTYTHSGMVLPMALTRAIAALPIIKKTLGYRELFLAVGTSTLNLILHAFIRAESITGTGRVNHRLFAASLADALYLYCLFCLNIARLAAIIPMTPIKCAQGYLESLTAVKASTSDSFSPGCPHTLKGTISPLPLIRPAYCYLKSLTAIFADSTDHRCHKNTPSALLPDLLSTQIGSAKGVRLNNTTGAMNKQLTYLCRHPYCNTEQVFSQ